MLWLPYPNSINHLYIDIKFLTVFFHVNNKNVLKCFCFFVYVMLHTITRKFCFAATTTGAWGLSLNCANRSHKQNYRQCTQDPDVRVHIEVLKIRFQLMVQKANILVPVLSLRIVALKIFYDNISLQHTSLFTSDAT